MIAVLNYRDLTISLFEINMFNSVFVKFSKALRELYADEMHF